jgi:NPCBM/NEW2 domain-containing protein/alpha galactosidase C-like protein
MVRARTLVAPLLFVAAAAIATTGAQPVRERKDANGLAGPVMPWPKPVPIRLKPSGRDDMMISTLGDVSTPLADGTFDPVADRVTTRDGRTLERYYKDRLDIPYFTAIDKSRYDVPPSGWCSWYYYYQEITADEVLANARWIARNLAPYGARYVQIDDGWQGTGRLRTRDWTSIDESFQALGMDGLAREIRKAGLEPGIWIAPHGQSNETVARAAGAFMFKPDGSSASESWEGRFLVDPSLPATAPYLEGLFRRLRSWGYTYFKIDGQTVVLDEFAKRREFMKGPVPEGPPERAAAQLYRGTVGAIRRAIGDDSYLLGCWGIPLAGMGLYNGSRTGGDVVQGWEGFLLAVSALQRWHFLHNIAWYSDPDVLLVRPPLSDGMARAWATIQGLTGEALMSSDRLPDLPAYRVELLKRVYPAVDIRPLDLYRPDNVRKPTLDLKVHHLGRQYDVVGVFNYDEQRADSRLVSWRDLGLDASRRHHVYDFWSGVYLGEWDGGIFVNVPPADVRVLTIVPASDRPVVVSTSRHITQGWVDLLDETTGGTAEGPVLSGRSRIVAGDDYTITAAVPRARPTFRLAAARAGIGARALDVTWANHQGHVTATIHSSRTDGARDANGTLNVAWTLQFEPAEPYTYPVRSPNALQVSRAGLTSAWVRWPAEYYLKAGYRVEVDGAPVAVAFEPSARLRDLIPGRTYRIAVRSIWTDGSAANTAAETQYTAVLPAALPLSELDPAAGRQDFRGLGRNRTLSGRTLTVAGREFASGIGTWARSDLQYDTAGAYARFTSFAGVDDETPPDKSAAVTFELWGDGRRLWRSDPISRGQAPVPVDVDIQGVSRLSLRATAAADADAVRVAWPDARLTTAAR